jgi:hypothetical protein
VAKPQKPNRIFWILFLGAVLFIFSYFYFEEPTAPARRSRVAARPTEAKQTGDFRPEDYKARFALLNEPAKNAFRPLVVRSNEARAAAGGGTPVLRIPSNEVPASMAGGDANWIYTGVATIDGVPNALLENSSSGDGVFLKPGDRWKGSTVLTVTTNSIVLQGPDRVSRTIELEVESDEATPAAGITALPPAGATPVVPPLAGAIGGLGVQPEAAPPVRTPGENRPGREERRRRRQNRGFDDGGTGLPPNGTGQGTIGSETRAQ